MPAAKRLIVGLGNPGAEYEGTRHNVGFAVVDLLAAQAGVTLTREPAQAQLAWGRLRGNPVGLVKPQTYMNRSGVAVSALLRRYGLQAADVLVVVDDIALPVGAVRVRQKGSAGGHNGLQDIIDRLGSDEFPRIRIGIGSDFARGRQAGYVLSPFRDDERPLVEEALLAARDAAVTYLTDGIVTAMNRFNRK